MHAVGREIKEDGFLSRLGFSGGSPNLDVDRLFISGQSLGGWTSIISCCGDQDIYKVSLTHDAAYFHETENIANDQIDLRVPSYMLMSNGFLSFNGNMIFKISKE